MKFSLNGLYIESYTKCANCGVLIYENSEEDSRRKTLHEGRIYCSQECVDWKIARDARHAGA
ncbi:hypothetical protein [Ensifer soli]|uniref:hypothetical protein n=1 Tax=Ciceribacter sp. sgz301302 TaxID=3342379 RepID=UPI0035BABE14